MKIKTIHITAQLLLFIAHCSGNTSTDALTTSVRQKKPWTIMIYMAATNDLAIFAPRNILQMQKIGSNDLVNIAVQHNFYEKNDTASKTFLIKEGAKTLISENYNQTDCGEAQTLINFCTEIINKFPAEHYALILWNHGTGALEPVFRSNLSIAELFSFSESQDLFSNPSKALSFLPIYETNIIKETHKGICFNDSTNKFMNEQQLCLALKTICATGLNNQKIDILAFDACFMAMVEVALAVEPYADIMVASQDVERGTGWNYQYALCPFLVTSPSPKELGSHFVRAYGKAYKKIKGFTQSCILLHDLKGLSNNISKIASLLQQAATQQENKNVRDIIKLSRNKHLCTHFDEPDFIDLKHFYKNLSSSIATISLEENSVVAHIVAQLQKELLEGEIMLNATIYENSTGQAFPDACGLSIYFPEGAIHSSYKKTAFASQTYWNSFLKAHLSGQKK